LEEGYSPEGIRPAEGLDEEGRKRFTQETHKNRLVELESIFRLNRKIDEKRPPTLLENRRHPNVQRIL